jgi:hypothetical protein
MLAIGAPLLATTAGTKWLITPKVGGLALIHDIE